MLRDHIVFATTCNSEMVRTKGLEVGDELTLDQARKFALTYEHTQRQLKEMGSTQLPHDVHSVKHVQRFPNKKRHVKPGKNTTLVTPLTITPQLQLSAINQQMS